MTLLLLVLGLLFLVLGAEALVRGASKLAATVGVSPLVIGLTVVAYGTSTPEMVVSVMSGLAGQADIALGNVVGSNIFNVLFILGISALLVPLVVSQQLVRFDVPLMIAVSLLLCLLGLDGKIGRVDGLFLFAGGILYTVFLIYQSRKENQDIREEYAKEYGSQVVPSFPSWTINTVFIVGGLGLLVLGSRWLVDSAVTIAQLIGVSELVIGLTIVAAGTSLPEVATSIIASLRGERDIAVGNVVGSNIFNILAVLGLSSIVTPDGIHVSTAAQRFDIPVMIAVAVACLPIFFTGHVIARWEGALFLGYYVVYTLYLILAVAQHAALPVVNMTMVWFVIPLTVLTLLVVTLRALRKRDKVV
jgi:cation:H+ antiporter